MPDDYDSTPAGSTPGYLLTFRQKRDANLAAVFGGEPPKPSGEAMFRGAMNRFLDGKWGDRVSKPFIASGQYDAAATARGFASWLQGMHGNLQPLDPDSNVRVFLEGLTLVRDGNMDALTQRHIDMLKQGDRILPDITGMLGAAGGAPSTLPPVLTQAGVALAGFTVESMAAKVYAQDVKPALEAYLKQRSADAPAVG